MPNKNYQAGRRFEYEVMRYWESREYEAMRTSGSHGSFDIIAIRADRKPEFVQCKRVSTEAEGRRLIRNFKEEVFPSLYFHQSMFVKVKGTANPMTITI